MRARRTIPVAFAIAVLLPAGGCIPSSVVAATDRSVVVEADRAEWRPATAADVPGLYRSGPMTGALATALLTIDYLFVADGTFTGSALFSGPPPTFRVLSGTWVLDDDSNIVLDGADPATLEAANGMLRLSGADGTVVLYREDIR